MEKEQDFGDAWQANVKRTYDEYQEVSLESIKRNRSYVDKVVSDTQMLSVQCMQNAIETANLNGKQAVRHADVAIDRQWNVDEQAWAVATILKDGTFKDAVAAIVVETLKENSD